jgi:hypothetical protein
MPLKPWYKLVTPREDLREGKPLEMRLGVSPTPMPFTAPVLLGMLGGEPQS